MEKQILGLDIGVSSVGLAIIKEKDGVKAIKEMAVRIVPEDPNFQGKFYSGNTASKNLGRTQDRSIRRGIQRFKIRRDKLYGILKANKMYPDESLFKLNAIELYGLRAKGVSSQLSLEELGRVLIHLNQRRGFLSNRKSNSEDENSTEYKKRVADLESERGDDTIGQHLFKELKMSQSPIEILLRERTYLRSSYKEEFDRIWDHQKIYYANQLTGGPQEDDNKNTLFDEIRNKTIFYQRPLKSQKGLVSNCTFEKYRKAVNKSSPYFEYFRIWQRLNDLSWKTQEGETFKPTNEQKLKLFHKLFYGLSAKTKYKLTVSKIKEVLGFSSREKIYLNFTELDGSRTNGLFRSVLEFAGIDNPEKYLSFNYNIKDEKGGLLELWHICYSLPTESEVVNTLHSKFGFTLEQCSTIANNVGFTSDYSSLSTKAIRKLIPYLENGLGYSEACDAVGYDHNGYKTAVEIKERLEPIKQNSLRNPVVEQILNQVVNMVNLALDKHGKFDEIRVELARELRNNAKTRKLLTKLNSQSKKTNEEIRNRLQEEYQFKIVNGRDVKRYALWHETNNICLYCNRTISKSEFISGQADIEHILPKSRSFSNSMNNFILAHRVCNKNKNQMTAFDYMNSKGEASFKDYIERVNSLYNDGKGQISRSKFELLMCKGEDIPSDFVERMKKDSQYIAKETVSLLKTICPKTYTTTGQITDFLREKWGLKEVLQEVGLHKYRAIGQTVTKEIKDAQNNIKTIEIIKDWSKRDDHRHHAIDALICSLTDQKIIFKLNNLNKIYQLEKELLNKDEKLEIERIISNELEDKIFDLKNFADLSDNWFDPPIDELRENVKRHLDNLLISIKKSNSKVLTKHINQANKTKPQTTWTPRGRLHEETVMGKARRIGDKKIKINDKFNDVDAICNPEIRTLLTEYISQHGGQIKQAFASKNLKANPIIYNGSELKEVHIFETYCTKRVAISENVTDAQISKITDKRIKEIITQRIQESGGKIKTAFNDLANNPIWLNKEKGIKIKSFTVSDESKVEQVRTGFVKTGGNHHALIYRNNEGKYNERVVSFWEAVEIGLLNINEHGKPYPIINRANDPILGTFLFSMQMNDLFVFDLKHVDNPIDENEINFFDPGNRHIISTKLYRLQKMTKKSSGSFIVDFRHHLETSVIRTNLDLKGTTWDQVSANENLKRLTKIRLNHLGDIIKIGE
jgi:CRISPR-associated endonuclease Csn1